MPPRPLSTPPQAPDPVTSCGTPHWPCCCQLHLQHPPHSSQRDLLYKLEPDCISPLAQEPPRLPLVLRENSASSMGSLPSGPLISSNPQPLLLLTLLQPLGLWVPTHPRAFALTVPFVQRLPGPPPTPSSLHFLVQLFAQMRHLFLRVTLPHHNSPLWLVCFLSPLED